MYIITHTDIEGRNITTEYQTLCYAVNHLLVLIYNHPYGDYKITFTRTGRKKQGK